jgi:hypothetical protein
MLASRQEFLVLVPRKSNNLVEITLIASDYDTAYYIICFFLCYATRLVNKERMTVRMGRHKFHQGDLRKAVLTQLSPCFTQKILSKFLVLRQVSC